MGVSNLRLRISGGTVSASTRPPAVGATVVTGQVPAGATATLKKNGTVQGAATVTAQGAASYTLGSPLVAGDMVSFPWTLTGESPAVTVTAAPTPLAISGADGTVAVGDTTSFTPTITGGTAPYNVTATGLPPGRSITNAATGLTTGTYSTAGSYNATYTVTDSSSPQQTASFMRVVTVNAAASVTLQALSLSPTTATVGTAYNGTISGATSGSTITLSGAGAAGLSVSGTSVTGTPTASGAVNAVETLANATNSPRTSSGVLSVAAGLVSLTNGARMMEVGHSYVANGVNANNTPGPNALSLSTQDVNLSEAVAWLGAGVRTEIFPSADTTETSVGTGVKRYYSGGSFGRGGETLAQTLARMTDTSASGVLNVPTAMPDVVLLRNEGQNENWAVSTVIADGITSLKGQIDAAFTAGAKRVIVTTEVPSGTSSTTNLATKFQAWNAAIRDLANYRPGVLVLDQAAIMGAPNGWAQAPAGWLRADNIHPSNIGTYWLAAGANGVQGLKALLDTIVPTGHGWYDAKPRLSTLTAAQEYLTGSVAISGSNLSGVKPTAIGISTSGVSSVVGALRANPLIGTDPGSGTVPTGAQYFDLTVTPSGTNATESVTLSWGAPPSVSALAGQYVQVEYELDLPSSFYLLANTLNISSAGSSRLVGQAAVSTNGPTASRSVKILSEPLLLPASPTTLAFSGVFAYRAADAATAGGAPFTITLRAIRARVVDDPKVAWKYTQ